MDARDRLTTAFLGRTYRDFEEEIQSVSDFIKASGYVQDRSSREASSDWVYEDRVTYRSTDGTIYRPTRPVWFYDDIEFNPTAFKRRGSEPELDISGKAADELLSLIQK